MRRREFVRVLGGVVAGWPVVARAQQAERIRTVGILLGSTDNPEMRRLLDAFMGSFKMLGWTEDRNVRFDIRWSGGNPQNNAVQAQELVRQRPDIIFAAPSNVVIALQKETHSIPIVFASVSDPIAQGVVDNLARPTVISLVSATVMGRETRWYNGPSRVIAGEDRFFAWIQWQRRILVRWEYHAQNFLGFVQLACLVTSASRARS